MSTLQPAERRRLQNRSEAQRAILEAAEAMLVADGYDQLSMRKLAARCGYTAPTIYHYFGDKPGLIDAVLDRALADLLGELRQAPLGEDPLADMRSLFCAFARWGLHNPIHYELLTIRRDPEAEPLPSGEEAQALFETPFADLAAQGRLVMEDVETTKQAFWLVLHGFISLQRSRPDVEWSEALMEQALDAMIRGSIRDPEKKP